MSRLLRADFSRLWKSRIFWIGMIFMAGSGLLAVSTQYREMISWPTEPRHIDYVLFTGAMFMPVVAAVFVGLFIGTEYSDGTIRNKLIVGQSRTVVYFSNFIVCLVALLMMHLGYIVVIVGIGFPLVGEIEMPVSSLVIMGMVSMVTVAALNALFLLMSMLIHSKANSSVVAIIVGIALLMSGMTIEYRLMTTEYYPEYKFAYYDEAGDVHEEDGNMIKNPDYLEGTKRKVYKFLYDFLPGCQMIQIAEQSLSDSKRLPLYSFSIVIVTTACGIFFFKRKNVK